MVCFKQFSAIKTTKKYHKNKYTDINSFYTTSIFFFLLNNCHNHLDSVKLLQKQITMAIMTEVLEIIRFLTGAFEVEFKKNITKLVLRNKCFLKNLKYSVENHWRNK